MSEIQSLSEHVGERKMTFWIDESIGPRTVALSWMREEYTDDGKRIDSANPVRIVGAEWVVRGGAHYVTYQESAEELERQLGEQTQSPAERSVTTTSAAENMQSETRTTLCIKPNQLTLIRHGAVRWNHVFREGHHAASTMHIGPMVLAVETWTDTLNLEICETAGRVELSYRLDIAGEQQHVKLVIQFGEEVETDA